MREDEGYREVLLAIREAYGMEIQALTVPQVATCLNCDERTVKMLIVKKKLHAVDISFGKKESPPSSITSVKYIFPSFAINFSCLQIEDN